MDLEEFREQKRLAREIQLDELCELLDQALEDLGDYEHLVDRQHKRTLHAQKLWQAETGNTYWPDLGKLIDWLLEKADLPPAVYGDYDQ